MKTGALSPVASEPHTIGKKSRSTFKDFAKFGLCISPMLGVIAFAVSCFFFDIR